MSPQFNVPSFEEYIDQKIFPIELYVKREDLIHPLVKGNKFRKLKYNIGHILSNNLEGLITFGGAYSNHLHASAACSELYGIKSVGIIRGEEEVSNEVLEYCQKAGMILHKVSREAYREKENHIDIKSIIDHYPNYLLIPEGGSNHLAALGVEELVNEFSMKYDYVFVAAGTGCTAGAIINNINKRGLKTKVVVISSLKGRWMIEEIKKYAVDIEDHIITDEYSQGGYAKINPDYLVALDQYRKELNVPIDHVYNGKLLYGLYHLCQTGVVKEKSKVLWINTGGVIGY
jgi:1-aminocyclopropane-1-carboxylate deaminase